VGRPAVNFTNQIQRSGANLPRTSKVVWTNEADWEGALSRYCVVQRRVICGSMTSLWGCVDAMK